MMQFKKARLGLAMAVALTGGVGMTNTAVAAEISKDGLGQVLIFPYYTVRDNYRSLFNITNTSDHTVAAKVRFREAHNSRDVLDFNIVLSPRDVWTGWLEDSATGPVLKSEDTSCTSPQMTTAGFPVTNVGYSGDYTDGPNTSIDRAREGYVEVIMMGYTDDSTSKQVQDGISIVPANALAYYAKHVNGKPRDCAKVDAMFLAGSAPDRSAVQPVSDSQVPANFTGAATATNAAAAPASLYGVNLSGDPAARGWLNGGQGAAVNPLKGNFTLLQQGQGVAGGTTAIAVADFFAFTNGAAEGFTPIADQAGKNLVTAQQAPYYLEPTLMSVDGLWTVDDDVVALLQRTTMINEWANNAKTGASVSWVVTMPTKNFYVDYPNKGTTSVPRNTFTVVNNNFQAAMNTARGYTVSPDNSDAAPATTYPASLTAISAFSKIFNGTSNVTLGYKMFDREEGSVSINSTTVSPQPPSTAQALKYEVNVLTFDGINSLTSGVSSNLTVPTGLSTPNGWLEANLGGAGGLPAVGFMWKKRDFGDATLNYGQITDHGYVSPAN